jgi:D-tagatose-1,6-bisphosphate aldolase subunit GatZ/KbaZ
MVFFSPRPLLEIVAAQKRGEARGIPSICSANPYVLEACLQENQKSPERTVLIESTCNQVNQYGGYMGLTPVGFADYVCGIMRANHVPIERLILGGDHLGPSPWRDEPVASAMHKAIEMVEAYVNAGYVKIHLDASMHCADDDASRPLPPEVSAHRTADLCAAAEAAAGNVKPVYVLGTEVPAPGGAKSEEDELKVTDPDEARQVIDLFCRVFSQRGLAQAWERVIAWVVQPGVEFGPAEVHAYEREKARGLSRMVEAMPGIVFEAHSTDYQLPVHLRQMVEDHFAILKVGPALTFAFREAIFALTHIESEWLGGKGLALSNLLETIERVMLTEPKHWLKYYPGSPTEQALARKYSLSDRIRYYWPHPEVQGALQRLMVNLGRHPLPLALLSQYLPAQYPGVRLGVLPNKPRALVIDHIQHALAGYWAACTLSSSSTTAP